mgnify:CR=1 FL=1
MAEFHRGRRDFLKGVGYGAAGLLAGRPLLRAAHRGQKRPNVLLIMADDVGLEPLGCYGGSPVETPRLDRLASSSTRFTHCYSCPVCHPSRLEIMTGRYTFRYSAGWGDWPEDEISFGQILQDAGYATAVAGKWQLTLLKNNPDHAAELGFQESCLFGWHEGPRYYDPYIYQNGEVLQGVKDRYGPNVYCEFLIDFMQRHREGPFFAYYPMALCHAIADDFEPPPPPGPDGNYETYAEKVEKMDGIVGRLLDALESLNIRENTVVMFVGDNGSPSRFITDVRDGKYIRTPIEPESLRGGKGSLTNAGTHVPLIVDWADKELSGVISTMPVDFTDFAPTLAEICGATMPDDRIIDGRSFAPRYERAPEKHKGWAYNERGGRAWVRDRKWKLYRNGDLYNVPADPQEKHPIDPEKASREARGARNKLQAVFEKLHEQPDG